MPKDEAEMMFVTAEQLWRAARDPQEQAETMPGSRTPIIASSASWGYVLAAVILRPLAAEYLLKGLSLRTTGRFLKTHDLLKVFEALDSEM